MDSGNKSSADDANNFPESGVSEYTPSASSSPKLSAGKASRAYQFTEIMYFSCFCLNFMACIAYGITLIVIEATEETESLTWMAVFPVQVSILVVAVLIIIQS
jgi:hypothetical protein